MSSTVPAADHLAAVDAGARADVHNVVGGMHGVLVVLHHDEGIAQIPQALQGGNAACRCPAGAGRCWARPEYTARPSARNRSGWPAGCAGSPRPTGSPADRARVRYSSPTLCRKPSRSRISLRIWSAIICSRCGELQVVDEVQCLHHRHLAKLADIDAAHRHRQALRLEALRRGSRGRARALIQLSISSCIQLLLVSRNRRSRLLTIPSKSVIVRPRAILAVSRYSLIFSPLVP